MEEIALSCWGSRPPICYGNVTAGSGYVSMMKRDTGTFSNFKWPNPGGCFCFCFFLFVCFSAAFICLSPRKQGLDTEIFVPCFQFEFSQNNDRIVE